MKNELKVTGKQSFIGIEIPIIEGGFGEDKRIVTAKTISEIHGTRLADVNATIKRMIEKKRLKPSIDYLDCLSETDSLRNFAEELGLIGSNRTQNVFVLSERGYTKLIKAMDDDKSWEVMDQFVDSYFEMRNTIKEVITSEDIALLRICKSNSPEETALAVTEYRKVVTTPLLETIEKQKPMAALAELRIDKKGCYSLTDVTKTLGLKRGQITRWAKAHNYIHKKIQEVNIAGEQFFKIYSSDGIHNSVGIKEDGLHEIKNKLEEIRVY